MSFFSNNLANQPITSTFEMPQTPTLQPSKPLYFGNGMWSISSNPKPDSKPEPEPTLKTYKPIYFGAGRLWRW